MAAHDYPGRLIASLLTACWNLNALMHAFLWLQDGQLRNASSITGTPQFMALSLISQAHDISQTASTDLESLFYTFLWCATYHKLHWKHGGFGEVAAHDAKGFAMVSDIMFSDKVLSRIPADGLKAVAKRFRILFYPNDINLPKVTVQQFVDCCTNYGSSSSA